MVESVGDQFLNSHDRRAWLTLKLEKKLNADHFSAFTFDGVLKGAPKIRDYRQSQGVWIKRDVTKTGNGEWQIVVSGNT